MNVNLPTAHQYQSFNEYAKACKDYRGQKRTLYAVLIVLATISVIYAILVQLPAYEEWAGIQGLVIVLWISISFTLSFYLRHIDPVKFVLHGLIGPYSLQVVTSHDAKSATLYRIVERETGDQEELTKSDYEELARSRESFYELEAICSLGSGSVDKEGEGYGLSVHLVANSGNMRLRDWLSNVERFIEDGRSEPPLIVDTLVLSSILRTYTEPLAEKLEEILNKKKGVNLFNSLLTKNLENVGSLVQEMVDGLNDLYDRGVIGSCEGSVEICLSDDSKKKIFYRILVKAGVVVEDCHEGFAEESSDQP